MVPILLNAAASVAGDMLQNVSDSLSPSSATAANPAASGSFASTLAQVQNSPAAQAAQQATLTSSLMASPEVRAAMVSVNPGQSAQLEISSSGNVSVRSANGSVKQLALSPTTRATVTQLYGLRQPTVHTGQVGPSLVLAVDPANLANPLWSSLPARG